MRDIRRPDSAEPLVEQLTSGKLTDSGLPVFPTIMDLLIFAAGVGLAAKRTATVPSSGKAVPYRIFENQQKEGYIHLVALAHGGDSAQLAVDKDDEAARIFEEYAAGGLEEIGAWLRAHPQDISGVQTILSQIQNRMETSDSPLPEPSAV